MRRFGIGVVGMIATVASAQWADVRPLGNGGETFVSSDGKGNVYATCHLPAKLLVSRDWGDTWTTKMSFNDACCDLVVIALPTGVVNVIYLIQSVQGITGWYSTDSGQTFAKTTSLSGPLDREWFGTNPLNGHVYMDYSKGYIGGPRSTGIFCAVSTDNGKTFVERSKVDNEGPNDEAVDPYLAVGTTGRIYAMWATSSDRNTIDRFRLAVSNDGGQTFTDHKTLANIHKSWGDTQERWMLGSIVAVGPDTVYAFYQDYAEVVVGGVTYHPLLVHYTVSKDGGVTFSAPATVTPLAEVQAAISNYVANKLGDANFPYYIQTLPWACMDAMGRIHVAWQDNRSGQGKINNTPYNKWHVRYTYLPTGSSSFRSSERVSNDVLMKRPPLDFLGCAADNRYFYVLWVETPNSTGDWNFTGNMYLARRKFDKSELLRTTDGGKVDR